MNEGNKQHSGQKCPQKSSILPLRVWRPPAAPPKSILVPCPQTPVPWQGRQLKNCFSVLYQTRVLLKIKPLSELNWNVRFENNFSNSVGDSFTLRSSYQSMMTLQWKSLRSDTFAQPYRMCRRPVVGLLKGRSAADAQDARHTTMWLSHEFCAALAELWLFLECLAESVTDICRSGSLGFAKTEVRSTWPAQGVQHRIIWRQQSNSLEQSSKL